MSSAVKAQTFLGSTEAHWSCPSLRGRGKVDRWAYRWMQYRISFPLGLLAKKPPFFFLFSNFNFSSRLTEEGALAAFVLVTDLSESFITSKTTVFTTFSHHDGREGVRQWGTEGQGSWRGVKGEGKKIIPLSPWKWSPDRPRLLSLTEGGEFRSELWQ